MNLVRIFQAARSENWWCSKIPPLLAVGYLSMIETDDRSLRAVFLLGCYLFSISCVAAYGHVINDSFDVEQDLLAGKRNTLADITWPHRLLLCAALVLIGLAPTSVVHYPTSTLLLLALNFTWPTVYSVPGLRLKERGIAGLVCDALGSHVTPTLVMLSLFGTEQSPLGSLFPIVVVAWSTALGLKGILHHQMLDRANDIRSGTVTFATASAHPERMSRFMAIYNLGVELPISALLAVLTWAHAPAVAVAFAIYCGVEIAKYRLGFQFALTAESWTVRRSVPFTNECFYTVWLPLAAVVQVAVGEPIRLWMPIVQVVLFYPIFAAQWRELNAVLRAADLPNRVMQRLR